MPTEKNKNLISGMDNKTLKNYIIELTGEALQGRRDLIERLEYAERLGGRRIRQ